MNTAELTQLALDTLAEHKAIDVTTLDVKDLTTAIDSMIICSATSRRHASAMADKLIRALKNAGMRPYGIEGITQGEWILIDLTDIVVHIMLPEVRQFYNLEKLWSATQAQRASIANHEADISDQHEH